MSVLVKALGYYSHKGGKLARGLARAKAHLKYLEYGKEHPNRPEGFDGDRDGVTRQEFMAHLVAQPERGVIAHKLVFSLSQEERDRLGVDMKELVRETMAAYQARTDRHLRWIAFLHDDPGHPHVHVVVAGYGGDGRQVGLYPRDLARLREIADRERDRLGRLGPALGPERAEERRERRRRTPLERQAKRHAIREVQQRVRDLIEQARGRTRAHADWDRGRWRADGQPVRMVGYCGSRDKSVTRLSKSGSRERRRRTGASCCHS